MKPTFLSWTFARENQLICVNLLVWIKIFGPDGDIGLYMTVIFIVFYSFCFCKRMSIIPQQRFSWAAKQWALSWKMTQTLNTTEFLQQRNFTGHWNTITKNKTNILTLKYASNCITSINHWSHCVYSLHVLFVCWADFSGAEEKSAVSTRRPCPVAPVARGGGLLCVQRLREWNYMKSFVSVQHLRSLETRGRTLQLGCHNSLPLCSRWCWTVL